VNQHTYGTHTQPTLSLFAGVGQGDVWSISGISFASAIGDILDKESFTLEELLQEDELLQEVKSRNVKLIELYVGGNASSVLP
jgi:serine/threonine-protein phosphatase 6 regulatory subunit 3